MKIFFSVGEPSGDIHGANLIRQLRSRHDELELVGYGGPKMAEAGCRLHADLTRLAVMFLLHALLNIHKFWSLLVQADRYFRHDRPDAVVLIDYPGFNWWIARRAKAHGIPVIYYGTPQMWGWAGWRVKKMRRFVDHVLVKLPFEVPWYRQRGCNATYVGHPFFDEVRRRPLDETFLAEESNKPGRLVAILPGSRTQEVTANLPWLLRAAVLVQAQAPDVRFEIAAYRADHAQMANDMARREGVPCEVHVSRTPELIRAATCCMSVSGSVSLELLHHRKPTVILYHISPFANWAQRWIRKVKYITLVNILAAKDPFSGDLSPYDPHQPDADDVLFPEYLTSEDRSADLAAHVIEWLTQPARLQDRIDRLTRLDEEVGVAGASERAAEYILNVLDQNRPPVPQPHFTPAKVRQAT